MDLLFQSGRIPVGQKARIPLSFAPSQAQAFSARLRCHVRGGKSIEASVQAAAEVPQLIIKEDLFDFQQVGRLRVPRSLTENSVRCILGVYLN